jgi:hypothetical protein
MRMIQNETALCPECGAKMEIINKITGIGQSNNGLVRRVIQSFNRCTNPQCDFTQTKGSAAYTNFLHNA